MPTSLGHGISDAVRNHIPVWVDSDLVKTLHDEYKKAGGPLTEAQFKTRIASSVEWGRNCRKDTDTGYER